jgi:hypothetical protein
MLVRPLSAQFAAFRIAWLKMNSSPAPRKSGFLRCLRERSPRQYDIIVRRDARLTVRRTGDDFGRIAKVVASGEAE